MHTAGGYDFAFGKMHIESSLRKNREKQSVPIKQEKGFGVF